MQDLTERNLAELVSSIKTSMAREDWKTARILLRSGLRISPTNVALLRLQWIIGRKTQRYRLAFRAITRIFQLYPMEELMILLQSDKFDFRKTPFSTFRERNQLYLLILITIVAILGLAAGFSFGPLSAVTGIATFFAGVIGAEALYRLWLKVNTSVPGERHAFPRKKTTKESFFLALNKPIETFSLARSYDMTPNSEAVRIGVMDDKVIEAHSIETDKNGNVGFTDEEFDPSAVNLLILGDSYTTLPGNGATADGLEGVEWPYFLRKKIVEEGLGPVRVINYGRSGHGVLQMADTAASVIDELKPDIVIFAFIHRDLTRYRYWHINRQIGGVHRGLRMQTPDINAPLDLCRDRYIIDDRITESWARERYKLGDSDELLKSIIKNYERLRTRTSARGIDLLSPHRLYSWDYLFFGTPFIDMELSPRVTWLKDGSIFTYKHDQKFLDAVSKIKGSGAQIWPVYLPVVEELDKGEIKFAPQESSLIQSLQDIVGHPIVFLKPSTTDDKSTVVKKYKRYPHDAHPSAWAQELLADALVREIKGPLRSAFKKTAR